MVVINTPGLPPGVSVVGGNVATGFSPRSRAPLAGSFSLADNTKEAGFFGQPGAEQAQTRLTEHELVARSTDPRVDMGTQTNVQQTIVMEGSVSEPQLCQACLCARATRLQQPLTSSNLAGLKTCNYLTLCMYLACH